MLWIKWVINIWQCNFEHWIESFTDYSAESLKTDGSSMCASFEMAAVCNGGPKSLSVRPAPTHTVSAGWAL